MARPPMLASTQPDCEEHPQQVVCGLLISYLELWPLQRIVGIIRRYREKGLAVCCIIALDGTKIHCAWYVLFVRMAGVISQPS